MQPLTFTADLLTRKPPSGIDVDTTLAHFAIITYLVDPDVARPHIHPRFQLDCIERNGREYGLLSVVPFVDQDFRFCEIPLASMAIWADELSPLRHRYRNGRTSRLVFWHVARFAIRFGAPSSLEAAVA